MTHGLLFDLVSTQPNVTGKRHGGGKYGEIVFTRILERHLPVKCYIDSTKWINPEIKALIIKNDICCFDSSKESLDHIVKGNNIDLLYSPLPNDEIFAFTGCRIIGTIHGLRGLETPLDSYYWKYKDVTFSNRIRFILKKKLPSLGYRKVYNQIAGVYKNDNFSFVTVSNHTRSSLLSYYPQYKDCEIPVFYSPSTIKEKNYSTKRTDKYFLLVSANRWEKNNLRAIMALDRLFNNGFINDFNVVVTGAKDSSLFSYSIKNKKKFSFVGYVDDEELNQLYHDAYCLIYPSLNEGFGYPPLEAMYHGVPVIASPFSSIQEVCEGNVIYFNPFSIEEIMSRLIQISDLDTHDKYSKLGKEQFEKIKQKQKTDLDALIDYIYR